MKEFRRKDILAQNTFTIIVPFRNESENLPLLLASFTKLDYPVELFEILLINDESEDDYITPINKFKRNNTGINLRVINNNRTSKSPKKDAIETGILHSNFDWIVTTDADCEFPERWITEYDHFIQLNKPVFIAGPVCFKNKPSFLAIFQSLDFSALIGCTIGGFGIKKPFMCNGANLCYQKSTFMDLDGFQGNTDIASGDDIFLLEKMLAKYPKQTKYLKSTDALVTTSTMPSLKELIHQRVRWASKTTSYNNNFAKFVGVTVLLMNIVCVFIITKAVFQLNISQTSLLILSLKIGIDFIIISIMLRFTKKTSNLFFYPIISIIHPFFNTLIAFISLFKRKYSWKNRDF
ncbi:MAG: glycosyltransferase [Flavobacteriaceae bacterium]|nr:glycosyltransferase [Flavobacteriaceae bacterium]